MLQLSRDIKKMAKKKTKAIVKKESKTLMWAGAQKLMSRPTNQEEKRARNIVMLTAKSLGISPFGVTLYASLPYINKLGLKQKQEQYQRTSKLIYIWIHYAKDDNEKAICQAKLIDGSKDLCDWVVGECSPSTMKMKTLTGYQNHMAQTRARNRAILETYGVKMHEEMMTNIEKMVRAKQLSEQDASQIGNAITTSIEEIQQNGRKNQTKIFSEKKVEIILAGPKEKQLIEKYCRELGATDPDKAYDLVKKLTGFELNFERLTKTASLTIIAALLQKQIAKRNGKKN